MCTEKQNLPQDTSHSPCVVKTGVRNRVRTLHSGAEFNRKILRGKPTRCRVIPGRPALLGWRGRPRPSRTAPLGMTKTPTLQVSADMLVSQSRALPPGPPLWVTEREVPSRLRPALTLDKPRIGGGSGPDLEARAPPWRNPGTGSSFPLPPVGNSGSDRGVRGEQDC